MKVEGVERVVRERCFEGFEKALISILHGSLSCRSAFVRVATTAERIVISGPSSLRITGDVEMGCEKQNDAI
jgi:hypothetical protein